MHKALLTAAIVILPLFTVAPAFAMKGIDAARACNSNPKCKLLLDDAGGATIIMGDTIIDCNSPQEECVIASRVVQANKGNFVVPTGGLAIR